MLRIYLDQLVWIALARAALGRSAKREVIDALEIARFGAEHGLLSFPLSPAHYMELRHASNARRRQEVADFMLELSHGHSMIGPVEAVVDAEIDMALFAIFGNPSDQRTVQVFGTGFGHAFGVGDVAAQLVDAEEGADELDPTARERLLARTRTELERLMLIGPAPGEEAPGYDPLAHLSVARAFVDSEVDQAQKFATYGVDTKYQRTVLLAREWTRLFNPVTDALARAGIGSESFFDGGAEFLTAFLEQLPVVFTTFEMRRLQHQNPQRNWTTNDQFDVSFLSMAVVHCDIVVTEKHWATLLRRAGSDQRYSAAIISDVAKLGTVLAAAA